MVSLVLSLGFETVGAFRVNTTMPSYQVIESKWLPEHLILMGGREIVLHNTKTGETVRVKKPDLDVRLTMEIKEK